jgi:ubiquinone/menaquinone biosynthesis C-methylase UbiE
MNGWIYDEFKHIGVDFADPQQVQTYDARQQTHLENEKWLVERLKIGASATVIEFGSGTCAFSLAAAMAGAQVTAVDISRAMLDYGRSKAEASSCANLQLVHAGFLTYDHHQQAPVDFVVTKFAFHHLPDFWKAFALRHIYSLLKPGGIFYLQDVVYSFASTDTEQHINHWIDTITSDPDGSFSRADFEMHVRDEYSTFGWIIEGLLRQEGFRIQQANYYQPTYAEYLCLKPSPLTS